MTAYVADPAALAFDEFEIGKWQHIATAYHENLGHLTSRAAAAVIAAARPRPSERLLDIGTGPGYVAAAAAEQGLDVTGCDISTAMVSLARTLHPGIAFEIADARDLPYPDECFDIVTSCFVLLHTALPEVMTAEAVRVLRPGGRFVASVYDEPGRARFAGVFGQALTKVQITPPAMPPGPGLFDLSSADRLEPLLRHTGLVDVRTERIELSQRVSNAAELFASFAEGTVRAGTILRAQSDQTNEQILAALAAALEPYRNGDHYDVPVSFLVASGTKPTKENA